MNQAFDVVVVGGGPNGLGIACYLGKCGLSVAVVEDRLELGGGAENAEPWPGFRIDPHATYFYGAAGPPVTQLELAKYGFRVKYYEYLCGGVNSEGRAVSMSMWDLASTHKYLSAISKKDADIWTMFNGAMQAHGKELLRSIYWTPPPPVGMEIPRDDLPWVKVLKKALPFFDTSWCDMSTFEILDLLVESEMLKVIVGMMAWYNGPHPDWAGTGIFGFTCNLLAGLSSGSPVGGMHSLTHALVRCALTNNVTFFTNCKVEEIIVEDGTAKGVILSDDSQIKQKKILADRAVISGVHVKDTFANLVPARHLTADFRKKVAEISLKGGSLFVLSLVSRQMPKWTGDAARVFSEAYPTCVFLPADSRDLVMNQTLDVYSRNTHPLRPESMVIPFCQHDIFDRTRCPEGYHVFSPIYLQMPAPEDHVDGPLAVNQAKDEITAAIMECIRKFAPNLTEDAITAKFVNTPYDSSRRNLGFVGGSWYGIRQGEDEWYDKRPLPELSRYRTPVEKLYLCNQSSYPGGLCLLAVPYNLMHVLIKDLDIKPGAWWQPSPFYIEEEA